MTDEKLKNKTIKNEDVEMKFGEDPLPDEIRMTGKEAKKWCEGGNWDDDEIVIFVPDNE